MSFLELWPHLVVILLAVIAYRLFRIQDTLSGGPERRIRAPEERAPSWSDLWFGIRHPLMRESRSGLRPAVKIAAIVVFLPLIALGLIHVLIDAFTKK